MDTSKLGYALMDAAGYMVATEDRAGQEWYILVTPDGEEIDTKNESYFHSRIYCDCNTYRAIYDTGAAVALCLTIAREQHYILILIPDLHNADSDIECGASFTTEVAQRWSTYSSRSATPAEALARLALAYYEGRGA